MFEHKSHPIISRGKFAKRLANVLFLTLGLVLVSLLLGMAGYMELVGLSPVDAFLEASMILGGMGPVAPNTTDAGKVFAGFYALYSGLLIIGLIGILLAPVVHRVLHTFHMDTKEK